MDNQVDGKLQTDLSRPRGAKRSNKYQNSPLHRDVNADTVDHTGMQLHVAVRIRAAASL